MTKQENTSVQMELITQGLNQLSQGMTVFDESLKLVAWNEAAMSVLELPNSFAKRGTHIGDVFRFNAERGDYGPGDVEEQVRQRVEIAARFEPHKFERSLPSGRIIEVEGAPLPSGGFITTYSDITERRNSEEELRQAHEELDRRVEERTWELKAARDELAEERRLLQTTLENMSQGISLTDAKLDIRVANRRFQELLEFPTELMKPNTNLADFFRYNAERGEYGPGDVEEQVRERVELALKFEPHRFRRIRPDGSVIEIVGQPLKEGGFVTTYEDVTLNVRAEEAIKQASRAKSDFLAKMSHELRTPLNAIIGLSELLYEDAHDHKDEAYIEPLRRLTGAGHHLLALINDILDLSKIEAGKVDLNWEETFVSSVLDQIRSTMLPLAEENGNSLAVEMGENCKVVWSDPLRLRQVFLNLIGNAAKFTENGQITVRVSRSSEKPGDRIVFTVEDTGIGISEERLGDLFSDFSQAPPGRGRAQDGTGLGLSISKKIVELMGGTIGAESEEGVGSRFWFTLLAAKP